MPTVLTLLIFTATIFVPGYSEAQTFVETIPRFRLNTDTKGPPSTQASSGR